MNNTKFPQHKAGDTFSYAGTCQLPTGTWLATAQVRTVADNALVGTITVTLGTAVGVNTPIALYAAAADTALWPAGTHQVDIRYADTSAVLHTSTLLLPVTRAVTQV